MKKSILIIFVAIYIILIVGYFEMTYDDNPTNNHIGKYLFIILLCVQSVHILVRDKMEEKKSSIGSLLLPFFTFGLLVWASIVYFT